MTAASTRGALCAVTVAWLASMSTVGVRTQEQRPADSTAVEPAQQILDPTDQNVEKDDPRARIEWQRQAWGVVTPAFRAGALREGRDYSDKKNARGPKWVNIG